MIKEIKEILSPFKIIVEDLNMIYMLCVLCMYFMFIPTVVVYIFFCKKRIGHKKSVFKNPGS